jgi:hypothetical protein
MGLVLSKLQRLEVLGGDLTITQSQLKHVTPNLTFLTIGSVSIDNLTEILQSLTPGISKLTSEIEIIKAICPSITTLGTPPKILFSGQEISFPIDCKALLLSQLDEILKKKEEVEYLKAPSKELPLPKSQLSQCSQALRPSRTWCRVLLLTSVVASWVADVRRSKVLNCPLHD